MKTKVSLACQVNEIGILIIRLHKKVQLENNDYTYTNYIDYIGCVRNMS